MRRHFEDACNEPQPGNWEAVCQLRAGHKGDHRSPQIGGWVWRWTQDFTWPADGTLWPVRLVSPLRRRNYIGAP